MLPKLTYNSDMINLMFVNINFCTYFGIGVSIHPCMSSPVHLYPDMRNLHTDLLYLNYLKCVYDQKAMNKIENIILNDVFSPHFFMKQSNFKININITRFLFCVFYSQGPPGPPGLPGLKVFSFSLHLLFGVDFFVIVNKIFKLKPISLG